MKIRYLIITNNPLVRTSPLPDNMELLFLDTKVKGILDACTEKLLSSCWQLALDPLSGRNLRPFPCLSVVLETAEGAGPPESDWKRLTDYAELDARRSPGYQNISQELKEDYHALDASLINSALTRLRR